MVKTPLPGPFARIKAMVLPSGDQAGTIQPPGSWVSWSTVSEPMALTYKLKGFVALLFPPSHAKTTWLPSGENDGFVTVPGRVVSGAARRFSRSAGPREGRFLRRIKKNVPTAINNNSRKATAGIHRDFGAGEGWLRAPAVEAA